MVNTEFSAALPAAETVKPERMFVLPALVPPTAVFSALKPDVFPAAAMFRGFHDNGQLVPPEVPAEEIVAFLESQAPPRVAERRRGES